MGIPCRYMRRGEGCTIYDHPDKPPVCSKWKCLWLTITQKRGDYHLNDPKMRPDKCKVMFRSGGKGKVIATVYPSHPRAWTRPDVYAMIEQWLHKGFTVDVYVGRARTRLSYLDFASKGS